MKSPFGGKAIAYISKKIGRCTARGWTSAASSACGTSSATLRWPLCWRNELINFESPCGDDVLFEPEDGTVAKDDVAYEERMVVVEARVGLGLEWLSMRDPS